MHTGPENSQIYIFSDPFEIAQHITCLTLTQKRQFQRMVENDFTIYCGGDIAKINLLRKIIERESLILKSIYDNHILHIKMRQKQFIDTFDAITETLLLRTANQRAAKEKKINLVQTDLNDFLKSEQKKN